MKRILAMWLVAAAAARADEPAIDVIALLHEVDAATRAVQCVSYTAESFGIGAMRNRLTPLRADMIVQQLPEEVYPQIRAAIVGPVDRRSGADDRSLLVSDGRKVTHVFETEQLYVTGVLPEAGQLLDALRERLLMAEFLHPSPFSDELEGDHLVYEGVRDVGGVDCHVVLVTYARSRARARWYFGVEDRLPHRVDRIFNRGGGFAGRALQLTDLRVLPLAPPETFAIEPPAGYRREVISSRARLRGEQRLLPAHMEAPPWTLRNAAGRDHTLTELRGRVVVLGFVAFWHESADPALQMLRGLKEQFADQGVAAIAIHAWERPDIDVAARLKRAPADLPILLEGNSTAGAYRVDGVPTFYVIGRDGRIVAGVSGAGPEQEVELQGAIEHGLGHSSEP